MQSKHLFLVLTAVMAMPIIVWAHGDAAPQPVDTTGLRPLGTEWLLSNPYRGDPKAIEIGSKGYNSNCARCHGLDVKSGGMAPDLRALEVNDQMDAWFLSRVINGAKRDDRVKMPPFENILSQEAMWAIRSYIDAQPDD
ncbi:MAG: cytochrome c-550 PedF [Hyphomicrobium sp.]|uniref:cytochrome c-550 PedF n=1 Tax=Hyphomicrobium sp. TaxID=82 RepID=UPI00132870B5|nr:cytochrome c-550 PedF [Hyphomicrobium sp.]KAB2941936.1 MAG: cytochrome c-550 PedF [Hyphomicrobium sp.]MBZ0211637.1 cytochrome c-550 PedF [Hyphomicrobium sp.]MCZ7595024.1 cytochrome c-550 PedF [Hyphomicrobium sp.]